MGIPSAPTPTAAANCVSNTPTQPPPTGRPYPHTTQTLAQTSAVDYPPPMEVPWKCTAAMMSKDKSCPGFHFNKPNDPPRLKFHQGVGCLALAKHGYICWKYVTASATIVHQFNKKLPRMNKKYRTSKTLAKRVSEDTASDHVSSRGSNPHQSRAQN